MVESVQSEAPTRKQQAQRELREACLAAARDIARREGWQAVTIRKVADAIGYAHPKLYELFENKNALLTELNREGFRQLLDTLRQTRAKDASPVALALAYCNFAWQQRELYEVMHNLGGAQIEAFTMTDEARDIIGFVRDVLTTWAESEGIAVRNADDAVLVLWSTLHGIASLALSKQMIGGKKHAAELAAQAVENLNAAWKARKYV
jgi:AcrR family transcriptional regulator